MVSPTYVPYFRSQDSLKVWEMIWGGPKHFTPLSNRSSNIRCANELFIERLEKESNPWFGPPLRDFTDNSNICVHFGTSIEVIGWYMDPTTIKNGISFEFFVHEWYEEKETPQLYRLVRVFIGCHALCMKIISGIIMLVYHSFASFNSHLFNLMFQYFYLYFHMCLVTSTYVN